jgi:hypothetical protein
MRLLRLLTALAAFGLMTQVSATTFKDAVKSMGPGNTGVPLARDLVTVMHLMSEKLQYDQNASHFFNFMNDALEDFDFARIYNSAYMVPTQGGFRSVTLNGRNTGQNYQVALSRDLPDYSALGNARAEYRMRQNDFDNKRTYTAQLDFDAALKKFDAQAMARLIENILRVVDADNLKHLHAAQSAICPEISGALRPVVDQAAADLPQSAALFCKYIELKSIGTPRSAGGKNYTEITMRGKFRMNALEQDYPQLKKFMKNIRNLFVLQIYTSDTKGRNLSSFVINAQTEEFYLAFNTAGGKILPMNKDQTPAFADAIAFSGVNDRKFYLSFNLFVNVHGLKINTGNIGAYLRYTTNNENLSFFAKLTHMPQGKVSGALFGVLPTWLIDLSIPSDLQTLMNSFTETVYKANNGEGSRAEIAWKKRAGQAVLHASASTEFLENRFIRIGMKIWVKKFRPNEHVQEDIRRFIGSFTRGLLNDLNAM